MLIDEIDSKSHEMELEKQPPLFNQSYKVKIILLVIYGLGGVHTHTRTRTHTFAGESDFKKPGVRQPPGLKSKSKLI